MRITQRKEKAIEEINLAIMCGSKGTRLNRKIARACRENDVKEENIKTILHYGISKEHKNAGTTL